MLTAYFPQVKKRAGQRVAEKQVEEERVVGDDQPIDCSDGGKRAADEKTPRNDGNQRASRPTSPVPARWRADDAEDGFRSHSPTSTAPAPLLAEPVSGEDAVLAAILEGIESAILLLRARRARFAYTAVADIVQRKCRHELSMARLAALTVLLPEALRLQRFGTAVEDFTVELLDPECSDADRHHASINRSMGIVKRRALLRQRLRERNGREIDTRDAGVPPPPLSPTQPSAATTLSSVTRSTEASSRPTLTALLGDDTALSAMTAEAGPTHSDTTASAKRKRASPFLPPQLLQKVRRREVQRERILATEAHDQQQLALARLIRTADLVHEWCRAPPSGSLANSGGASGGRGCIPVGELVSLIQRHHPAGPLSQADAHEQLQLLARCASGWCHLERGTHTGMTLFRLERHGPRFGQVRAALLAIKSLPME